MMAGRTTRSLARTSESILIEVLTHGAAEQAKIEKRFNGPDVHEHIQWLVDAALLERTGSADKPILARGKRIGLRR